MKKRLFLTAISAAMSLGVLGACGTTNNLNDDNGVNFKPVRYDRQDDQNMFDRERRDVNQNLNPVRYEQDMNNGIMNEQNAREYHRIKNRIIDDRVDRDIMERNRMTPDTAPGTTGNTK